MELIDKDEEEWQMAKPQKKSVYLKYIYIYLAHVSCSACSNRTLHNETGVKECRKGAAEDMNANRLMLPTPLQCFILSRISMRSKRRDGSRACGKWRRVKWTKWPLELRAKLRHRELLLSTETWWNSRRPPKKKIRLSVQQALQCCLISSSFGLFYS